MIGLLPLAIAAYLLLIHHLILHIVTYRSAGKPIALTRLHIGMTLIATGLALMTAPIAWPIVLFTFSGIVAVIAGLVIGMPHLIREYVK